ncbi:MAG TPA: transcription termination factor NusA [Thermoanaerobaculia bacterium]|nr:transcription termination factor NusA [Thermoanaerobaculia bacterium]
MTNDLASVIRQVSREKDIDPEKMFGALEEAMASAARRYYKVKEIVAKIDRETGSMSAYTPRKVVDVMPEPVEEPVEPLPEGVEPPPDPATLVLLDDAKAIVREAGAGGNVRVFRPGTDGAEAYEVEEPELGDELRIYRSTEGLGRIAAQNAKQVLYQKVREAERERIYNEYIPKVGELINGTVKRFERGDIVVDLGRLEAVIPRDQQSRAERYGQGERVRAVIADVHKNPKGPQIILSRTDPRLLIRLFEMEVPEIYDGTVVIKGAVRQPGERAKVAVLSRERDVDPVGACVGMRGSRVQAIMRELHGEKIDVIQYSDDLITFAQNALSPAKITRVSPIHHEDAPMTLDCVVEDEQLSLAIGKKGQNVRLASALIGAKIEIKSEAEVKGEVAEALGRMLRASQRQQTPVSAVPGIDADTAAVLEEGGVANLDQLLGQTVESLAAIEGIGEERAREILEAAQEFDNPTPDEAEEESEEGAADGAVLEEPAVEEKG